MWEGYHSQRPAAPWLGNLEKLKNYFGAMSALAAKMLGKELMRLKKVAAPHEPKMCRPPRPRGRNQSFDAHATTLYL